MPLTLMPTARREHVLHALVSGGFAVVPRDVLFATVGASFPEALALAPAGLPLLGAVDAREVRGSAGGGAHPSRAHLERRAAVAGRAVSGRLEGELTGGAADHDGSVAPTGARDPMFGGAR
jgi:hypothetical protein